MKTRVKTIVPESLPGSTSSLYGRTLIYLIMLTFVLLLIVPGCGKKDATVWVASPWQRVLRSTPPGEQMEVKLKAAANEYEAFRLIIHAGIYPLDAVNVTVSSLKSLYKSLVLLVSNLPMVQNIGFDSQAF